MDVPVAKTQGTNTGCRWPFASRGNKQRRCETRFSSTRPLWRRVSPHERIAAVSNSGTTVQVAAARSPTSLPTFSCGYNRAAPDPCRRSTSEVRFTSDLPQRHREQHPQEAPPRGGASFLFETGLRPTRRYAQRAAQAWWNAQPRGGKSRTGRSGRTDRPPLQRADHVASGRLALAIALRLQAVEISNCPLRMGGC